MSFHAGSKPFTGFQMPTPCLLCGHPGSSDHYDSCSHYREPFMPVDGRNACAACGRLFVDAAGGELCQHCVELGGT